VRREERKKEGWGKEGEEKRTGKSGDGGGRSQWAGWVPQEGNEWSTGDAVNVRGPNDIGGLMKFNRGPHRRFLSKPEKICSSDWKSSNLLYF
jgi:hypothetical protein